MRWGGACALGLCASLCYGQVSITGTVGAPGGTLAFNPPAGLADFFGRAAHAHLPGLQAVSGATVELIELDSKGERAGAALASGSTNSRGVYTLTVPARFEPAAQFVVRAVGSGSHRLDAFVTGPRVNIDPATDATRALVIAAVTHARRRLADVRIADVMEVLPLVQHLAWEVDPSAAGTSAGLATALRTAATNDEEISNVVASIVGAGEIKGTVTDAARKRLARITIVLRDSGSRVTRAIAHTDAQGRYSVRVPPGDYLLGAINQTAASTAASRPRAERITVAATPVTRNLQLGAGGRISGTVTAEKGGARLTGIHIKLRDSRNAQPDVEVRTEDDGGYRVNLAPGSYFLIAENTTLQPYAPILGTGARLDVQRGAGVTAHLALQHGHMISGVVTSAARTPLAGVAMRLHGADDRERATLRRTNRAGEYRLWVRPGRYVVLARGQAVTVDATAAGQARDLVVR